MSSRQDGFVNGWANNSCLLLVLFLQIVAFGACLQVFLFWSASYFQSLYEPSIMAYEPGLLNLLCYIFTCMLIDICFQDHLRITVTDGEWYICLGIKFRLVFDWTIVITKVST